jgi:hypothetical protein
MFLECLDFVCTPVLINKEMNLLRHRRVEVRDETDCRLQGTLKMYLGVELRRQHQVQQDVRLYRSKQRERQWGISNRGMSQHQKEQAQTRATDSIKRSEEVITGQRTVRPRE